MCCSTCGSKVGGRDVRGVWRLCLWLIVESRMANLKAQTSSDSRQAERGMPNGLEERSAERELSLDLQPEQSTDCEMMEKLSWMGKSS